MEHCLFPESRVQMNSAAEFDAEVGAECSKKGTHVLKGEGAEKCWIVGIVAGAVW